MAVKINVFEELGIKKKIVVKESNANMRKALEFQKNLTKLQIDQKKKQDKINELDEDDSEDPEVQEENGFKIAQMMSEMFDLMLGHMDSVQEFIIDMLKLDEKAQEKMDSDLDFDQTVELSSKIVSAILKVDVQPTGETSEEGGDLKA
ncbi:phage tail assembly chaperone [Fructobacillus sp. M158]|uniref:phage tail assembly chaperone n=1 Tax=Fructobacillus parabroussonetiae TaxID=2713174 RepID=UPI00200AC097|nr:phage tail assembly chaperone [Fructobacillus parabroussonetiae]MCK8617557.1 phage tail assembly chaperone [Fructobacillus parabroussonetiae]